jgi:hypothetical protein
MQKGELVTVWRSISSALNQMQTWSDIPADAAIKVTVEVGDGQNSIIDSKTVDLKSGHQNVPLAGLKAGDKARLRVQLAASKWGHVPVLQTVSLPAGGESVRWATVADWRNGSQGGGLVIQK